MITSPRSNFRIPGKPVARFRDSAGGSLSNDAPTRASATAAGVLFRVCFGLATAACSKADQAPDIHLFFLSLTSSSLLVKSSGIALSCLRFGPEKHNIWPRSLSVDSRAPQGDLHEPPNSVHRASRLADGAPTSAPRRHRVSTGDPDRLVRHRSRRDLHHRDSRAVLPRSP